MVPGPRTRGDACLPGHQVHRHPCFRRFGDAVSTARREGDVHPHKAIIADTMQLLGNSGYGKTITDVDRHRDVKYCPEKAASLMVNDRRFRQLDVVVDDAYTIAMKKETVMPCPYMWGSSFCSTPRCACSSSITTLSTGTWSVFSVLRDGYRYCLFGLGR